MKFDVLEDRMRELEYFHSLRLLPGAWAIIRVDGRGFSKFTQSRFEKPFDEKFRGHMIAAASALMIEMKAIYAYTESDEISLLLPPTWNMFDRELEKTVSITAGVASSAFTLSCGEAAHFDSRVWLGTSVQDVIDYFRWRQSDAGRCALNGWCYWTLRNAGGSVDTATQNLKGISNSEKNELLFRHGINYNDVPLWQRRGIGIYFKEYEKIGFNPISQTEVTAMRRMLHVDLELPMKDEYDEFINKLIITATIPT